jgi:beta-N-acetylhexosaminidase
MSAHIAFPAFTGPDEPGTLSRAVMTGLLRDSLHFRGLVVTDALMMGAIVAKYGAGEATVRAFLAGSDLLLYPSNPDSAFAAMNAAVASGRISMARLDSSVHRMLEIKSRLGLFTQRYASLSDIMATVGAKRFQTAAQDLAVRALTLVRDSTGTLTRLRARRTRMALIAYADEFSGSVGLQMAEILRQNGDSGLFPAVADVRHPVLRLGAHGDQPESRGGIRRQREADQLPGQHRAARFPGPDDHGHRFAAAHDVGVVREPVSPESGAELKRT